MSHIVDLGLSTKKKESCYMKNITVETLHEIINASEKTHSKRWVLLSPSKGVDANWHVSDDGDIVTLHANGIGGSTDEYSKAGAEYAAISMNTAADLAKILLVLLHDGYVPCHDITHTNYTKCIKSPDCENCKLQHLQERVR